MKKITYTELRKLPLEQVEGGECFEVTANCEHLGFFIIGSAGAMRETIRNSASMIDAGKGR